MSGREGGGVLYGREAAQRRHICHSINFLLCGAWVSTLAAGAPTPVILELRWRNKTTQKSALHRAQPLLYKVGACPCLPQNIHSALLTVLYHQLQERVGDVVT